MAFIDEAKIYAESGKGGDGVIRWLRTKESARGGPAGGDGGKGGSVFLEADRNLTTLLDFKYRSIFKAESGENGGPKNKSGKSGKDLICLHP